MAIQHRSVLFLYTRRPSLESLSHPSTTADFKLESSSTAIKHRHQSAGAIFCAFQQPTINHVVYHMYHDLNNLIQLQCKINRKPSYLILDTGSHINLVVRDTCLLHNIRRRNPPITILGIGPTPIYSSEETYLTISLANLEFGVVATVLDTLVVPCLIGMRSMEMLGINIDIITKIISFNGIPTISFARKTTPKQHVSPPTSTQTSVHDNSSTLSETMVGNIELSSAVEKCATMKSSETSETQCNISSTDINKTTIDFPLLTIDEPITSATPLITLINVD